MNNNYMVYVSCMTYNHSAYIKDALDGFSMQQTDFPFVCGIIDDASSDGEPEIIQHYLEEHFDLRDDSVARRDENDDCVRVFAQHKFNKNCYFAVIYLKYNHYRINKAKDSYVAEWKDVAKYYALCEGDDYWTDPKKLFKQVCFMESHPSHSICFCAHQVLSISGNKALVKRYDGDKDVCPMEDIILGGGGFMATNSMLFRKSSYVPYQTWAIDCPIGDLPVMLTLANNGLVGYLAEAMCVYRKLSTGSWTSQLHSSISLRRIHHHAIDRMWRQFDEWSNGKYHGIIQIKRRKIQLTACKDEIKSLFRKVLKK